ncbi:hypothetical protein [Paenibacillus sp. GCM10012306]|uniref:hypothetical protein n=1 Tax=Paenibacillus sp. GCM10012306 TaxID=3317342 RepID=UPI00360803E7
MKITDLLLRKPLGIIGRNIRPYLVLNLLTYGLLILGLILGYFFPSIAKASVDAMASVSSLSPAQGGVMATIDSGNAPTLAVIILIANLCFGALGMATLPSLLIPFSGIVIHALFAGFLGLTYAPYEGWDVLLPHSLTLLIELQAYIVLMLGAYLLGKYVLSPQANGFTSRWAGYKHGLVETAWLYIPAIVLLILGAIYEGFEVVALLSN